MSDVDCPHWKVPTDEELEKMEWLFLWYVVAEFAESFASIDDGPMWARLRKDTPNPVIRYLKNCTDEGGESLVEAHPHETYLVRVREVQG